MLNYMDDHYDQMKNEIGVDKDYDKEPDDPMLDVVLKKLRPNSTAANFREFMTKSQNIQKKTDLKEIARKVNAKDDRKARYEKARLSMP